MKLSLSRGSSPRSRFVAPDMSMTLLTQVTYPVVETFHSLQGEGAWTGVSAFFIRLGGCDVHCSWCDTKESWNPKLHPQRTVPDLVAEATAATPAIVVVTGGEPLMHDLTPLSDALRKSHLRVHLETSGAHIFTGNFDWVTLSPKTFQPPHPSVYPHADELKVVVAHPQDLEWAEQEALKVKDSVMKYLQPEWNTSYSRRLVFAYILQHPSWRFSLQSHKFLEIK